MNCYYKAVKWYWRCFEKHQFQLSFSCTDIQAIIFKDVVATQREGKRLNSESTVRETIDYCPFIKKRDRSLTISDNWKFLSQNFTKNIEF